MAAPGGSNSLALRVVLATMLIVALGDLPYGYYQLLRWSCFVGFAYLAYRAHARGAETWTWMHGAIAVLYNPFVPLALGRSLWEVANVVTAGVLVTSALLERQRETSSPQSP